MNTAAMLTEKEICRDLHVSKTTVWRWRKHRLIPFLRIGRRIFYPRERFSQFLRDREELPIETAPAGDGGRMAE
jgi:excisionase family DNA binding protein